MIADTTSARAQIVRPLGRLAVLLTSFNRRALTLEALAALFAQKRPEEIYLEVFLVDDGCTDGTGDAVQQQFPQVRVLQGDGTLFWEGGMRMAFTAAAQEDFDAYLLLNDDTLLYPDAIARIVACANGWRFRSRPAIIAGSTRSPLTGEHSYGGFAKRIRGWSFRLEKVLPELSCSVSCDTINGNVTLIPREIAAVVGNFEPGFRHKFGDVDYGLRAKQAGFDVALAPGYVGECAENPEVWRDPAVSFLKRWKHLNSPKGVPLREWLLFTRRHYGWRWLHYFWSPYLKTIASGLLSSGRSSL